MFFNVEKKPMSLRDYLHETYEPSWRLSEDKDYIILRNEGYDKELSILIDREAYHVKRGNIDRFFDIYRMTYTVPHMEYYGSQTTIRFGNFFEDDDGSPRFFLTEPKCASAMLIFRGDIEMVKSRYVGDHITVVSISDAEFHYPGQISRYIKDVCQSEFAKAVFDFCSSPKK